MARRVPLSIHHARHRARPFTCLRFSESRRRGTFSPPMPSGAPTFSRTHRACVLCAVDAPKPWGWEKWLTSTRPEGAAQLVPSGETLAQLVATHPEVLGPWSRRMFGDECPTFTKLIHTNFPSRVHLGFRRAVSREELGAWLDEEQTQLRRLFAALRVADAHGFAEYQTR